jgi:hypothetical protein
LSGKRDSNSLSNILKIKQLQLQIKLHCKCKQKFSIRQLKKKNNSICLHITWKQLPANYSMIVFVSCTRYKTLYSNSIYPILSHI